MKFGHFLLNQFWPNLSAKKSDKQWCVSLFWNFRCISIFGKYGGSWRPWSPGVPDRFAGLTVSHHHDKRDHEYHDCESAVSSANPKKSKYPWNLESKGNCYNQEGDLYSIHYDQRKELGRGKFGVVYHVKVGLFVWCCFLCSFPGILLFQDKQTDRCYAAKHIRIRKPEQKEKVEHSDEKRTRNELIFLVLQGGGGDQPAKEVFKSPHNPFHRGVWKSRPGNTYVCHSAYSSKE